MKKISFSHILFTILTIISSIDNVWSQTTIVQWTFQDMNAIADGGITGNLSQTISTNTGGTVSYASGSGGTGTYCTSSLAWNAGSDIKCWEINFLTTGYSALTISSKQRSGNTGPRDFKIQYKIGSGGTYTDLTGATSIILADNWTSGVVSGISLPVTCNNESSVNIRWIMTSNTSVNSGTVIASGSSRIDDILVTGYPIPEIIDFTPADECAGSGSPVTISGTNFQGATSVKFNGTNAGSYSVDNASQITATPAIGATTGAITVTTSGGTASSSSNFTVNPKPAAVSVSGAGIFCNNTDISASNGNDGTIYFQGTTSGGTSTTIPSASQTVNSSGTYYFRAQSSAGCWGNEGSTNVTIISSVVTPSVSISPASNPVIFGSGAIFSATPVNGGIPSYQWYKNGSTAGTNSDHYSYTPAVDGDQIYVVMTSSLSCVTSSTATSNTVTMDVISSPTSSTYSGTGNWSNQSNWSNGLPGNNTNVIVTGNLNVDTPSECNDFTITQGGTVSIPAGNTLTCNGNFLIQSGAGGSGSFIGNEDDLAVNGTVTVQRNITGAGWHLISAPVSGAVSGMFTGKYLQSFDEGTNLYTDIQSVNVPLTPLQGFALYGAGLWQYSGSLNSGNFGSADNLTRSAGGDNSGWNLVGNPYPSSIDWDENSGWVKDNVNDAIYFHVNNTTWATYGSEVAVPGNAASNYIAPGQGFFVEVSDGAAPATGTLIINNLARVHHASAFFKKKVNDLIRLQVSGNGYTDETVIRFLPDATTAFDSRYDAHKLFGDSEEAPQLYSLGNTPLAINALPEASPVQIGMRVGTNGLYTIGATEVNGIVNVTLEDTKTNIFTDLLNSTYSFSYSQGESEQRFVLHFNPSTVSDLENSTVNVYSDSKTVYVDKRDSSTGNILIYNISGQIVAKSPAMEGINKIILENTGNYIVKIITSHKIIIRKVWVQ